MFGYHEHSRLQYIIVRVNGDGVSQNQVLKALACMSFPGIHEQVIGTGQGASLLHDLTEFGKEVSYEVTLRQNTDEIIVIIHDDKVAALIGADFFRCLSDCRFYWNPGAVWLMISLTFMIQ